MPSDQGAQTHEQEAPLDHVPDHVREAIERLCSEVARHCLEGWRERAGYRLLIEVDGGGGVPRRTEVKRHEALDCGRPRRVRK